MHNLIQNKQAFGKEYDAIYRDGVYAIIVVHIIQNPCIFPTTSHKELYIACSFQLFGIVFG